MEVHNATREVPSEFCEDIIHIVTQPVVEQPTGLMAKLVALKNACRRRKEGFEPEAVDQVLCNKVLAKLKDLQM